jgi:hypothetical protein
MQHMDMEKVHQLAENADINGVEQEGINGANVRSNFPDQLRRRYEVYLTLPGEHKVAPMRSVTSHHLGSLVKIKVRMEASVKFTWHGVFCRQGSHSD